MNKCYLDKFRKQRGKNTIIFFIVMHTVKKYSFRLLAYRHIQNCLNPRNNNAFVHINARVDNGSGNN